MERTYESKAAQTGRPQRSPTGIQGLLGAYKSSAMSTSSPSVLRYHTVSDVPSIQRDLNPNATSSSSSTSSATQRSPTRNRKTILNVDFQPPNEQNEQQEDQEEVDQEEDGEDDPSGTNPRSSTMSNRRRATTRVARVFSTDELRHLKKAWTSATPSALTTLDKISMINYPNLMGTLATTPNSGNTSLCSSSNAEVTFISGDKSGNLSLDAAASFANCNSVTLTIVSSSVFNRTASWSTGRGGKIYYLLNIVKDGAKAGMVLRSYRHFMTFHSKLESHFPALVKDIPLPKKVVLSEDRKELLSRELQDYLNKITAIVEIIRSPVFSGFLDATECPLLVYIKDPEREGPLKLRSGILTTWTEIWAVIKYRRLYYYLDNSGSSVPYGNILLRYATISIPVAKDKSEPTFEIRIWNRNKELIIKAKDEQERNDWVVALRNAKAKVLAEIESVIASAIPQLERTEKPRSNYSDVLLQYAAGNAPNSPTGTRKKKYAEQFSDFRSGKAVFHMEEDSENNIVFHQKKLTIKGATVEKLIEKLTEEEQDMDFVFAFLLTYRSFTTPMNLLTTCIQRFLIPPVKQKHASLMVMDASKGMPIHPTQLRVCTVLQKWLEVNFHDFVGDAEFLNTFIMFIENELVQQQRFQIMGKKLKDLIKKKINPEKLQQDLVKAPTSELPAMFNSVAFDIMDLSPIEVTRQITLIEFELFRAVEPKECLGQKWNKKDQKDQASHVLAVVKRFNQISNWVVTKIVLTEDFTARVALVTRFIEIAQQCIQINNYNTAMEIISGLNSSSVYRLNKTWEALSSNIRTTFNRIRDQLAVEGSYKALRDLLHNRQPPCIPYFGIYLTDLVFIDDGNPDKLENGLINFEKNYLLYKVIKEIQLYQQTPYLFHPVEEIQSYFLSLRFLEEKDAYSLSLKCEPREPSSS